MLSGEIQRVANTSHQIGKQDYLNSDKRSNDRYRNWGNGIRLKKGHKYFHFPDMLNGTFCFCIGDFPRIYVQKDTGRRHWCNGM